MDNRISNIEQMHSHCETKCVSWGAIFSGALVGLGLSFLLNLFSLAIGLSAFSTTQQALGAFAVGGFLGFAIGAIACMFVSGWVAGYLGRVSADKCYSGVLYGFVTWCLSLIFAVTLAMPIAKFVSSYSGYMTNNQVTVIKFQPNRMMPLSSDMSGTSNVATVDAVQVANDTGKVAFALFVLFFISALASCFGGHYGMVCRTGCQSMRNN